MAPLKSLTIALTISLASGFPLQAQRPNSRIFGTVIDVRSQAPIASAEIIHLGDGRITRSDSLGLYRFDKLTPGLVKFMVRAAHYPTTTFVVALTPNETLEYDFEVDTASQPERGNKVQALPEVSVKTTPSLGPRFADFEARRVKGRGQYLTREQIELTGLQRLHEVLRTMRGVAVECSGGLAGCVVRMVRAPMQCLPEYIVDERVDNEFGPYVALKDIVGIELYTGPADVPAEWAGRNAGCGLVVIWTQAGPPRPRTPKTPPKAKPDSVATKP